MNQDSISFDLPKNRSNVIKVIGVGGGGSNAVNYMFNQGFNGVDFVVCNTDAQALHSSPVPNKIQLGVNLTEGLGAGARPSIGGEAAEESLKDLESMLSTNTKMLFLTAGMGGGTGTGAAPVIAKLASELGILTVGIVTMPFKFEGAIRQKQAQEGMEELQKYVDSMIVINNNKLRDVYGNLGLKSGFAKADEVLATAAKGISEVITKEYGMNIDLHDVKTVLEKSGTAIMGAATASGEDRAIKAISKALDSPLLNDNSINGAKNVLLLVVSGDKEITLDEIGEINEHIQEQAGGGANIILGAGDEEEGLGDDIKITIIATGFSKNQQDSIIEKAPEKKVYVLGSTDAPTTKVVEEKIEAVVSKVELESTKSNPRIVHTLEEEVEEEQISTVAIQRTESVVEKIEEEETYIQPLAEESNDVVDSKIDIMNVPDNEIVIQDVNDSQTTIEFDFGSIDNNKIEEPVSEKTYFDLGSQESEEVEDTNEKLVVSESNSRFEAATTNNDSNEDSTKFNDGSIKYNLEDFEKLEHTIEVAKPKKVEVVEDDLEEQEEPEMKIQLKQNIVKEEKTVVERPITHQPIETETFVDPTDIPLSKKDKIGRERRERLKRFNHNFKTRSMNPSSIDDLEKQPAYLRAGIDVSSSDHRNRASRYSLGSNDNDDVVIRRNNSFLHDNVD